MYKQKFSRSSLIIGLLYVQTTCLMSAPPFHDQMGREAPGALRRLWDDANSAEQRLVVDLKGTWVVTPVYTGYRPKYPETFCFGCCGDPDTIGASASLIDSEGPRLDHGSEQVATLINDVRVSLSRAINQNVARPVEYEGNVEIIPCVRYSKGALLKAPFRFNLIYNSLPSIDFMTFVNARGGWATPTQPAPTNFSSVVLPIVGMTEQQQATMISLLQQACEVVRAQSAENQ